MLNFCNVQSNLLYYNRLYYNSITVICYTEMQQNISQFCVMTMHLAATSPAFTSAQLSQQYHDFGLGDVHQAVLLLATTDPTHTQRIGSRQGAVPQ